MTDQQPTTPKWQQRVRDALDDNANQIDYATQLALARARATALAQPPSRWQRLLHNKKIWLGTAVPAALAVFFMLQFAVPGSAPTDSHSVYEDLELLADSEDLDTFSELEMYEWMSESNTES